MKEKKWEEREKWGIKEKRRYGAESREISKKEDEDQSIRGKRKCEIETEGDSSWTLADLSWLAIRRTSRPRRLQPGGNLTSAKSRALRAPVEVKLCPNKTHEIQHAFYSNLKLGPVIISPSDFFSISKLFFFFTLNV